jgi:hypothetical protein
MAASVELDLSSRVAELEALVSDLQGQNEVCTLFVSRLSHNLGSKGNFQRILGFFARILGFIYFSCFVSVCCGVLMLVVGHECVCS